VIGDQAHRLISNLRLITIKSRDKKASQLCDVTVLGTSWLISQFPVSLPPFLTSPSVSSPLREFLDPAGLSLKRAEYESYKTYKNTNTIRMPMSDRSGCRGVASRQQERSSLVPGVGLVGG